MHLIILLGHLQEVMIELSNLTFQVDSKKFTNTTRKYIRVSLKSSMASSKKPSIFVNNNKIKWQEPLDIEDPEGHDVDFEIYDKHEFGYNPEELENMYGTIKIQPNQKVGKWNVFSIADNHQKVGVLMCDINKMAKQTNNTPPTSITSILIRKLKKEMTKGYIIIKYNLKVLRTHTISPISKEFLWADKYELGRPKPEDNLLFELYGEQDKMVARGKIVVEDCRSSNKIDLYDSENNEHFAELYFEVEQSKERGATFNGSTKFSKISSSPTNLSRYRSISESNLTKLNYQTFGNPRKKRMSVLNNNGDVVFPKEERFMIYQDKQTDVISYSRLGSFKFFDNHSKKYYKGASIGVGSKTDFTRPYRGNPGVGNYKLPSIFDRY